MSIKQQRQFGVLFPFSAMPSKEGIGTMGEEAYHLVDFLAESGAKVWQMLPLGPTSLNAGSSPYMAPSTVAGNPLLISIQKLVKDNLLPQEMCYFKSTTSQEMCSKVDYEQVTMQHMEMLKRSYDYALDNTKQCVNEFVNENRDWLPDYALFTALHDFFKKPFWEWEEDVRDRNEETLKSYRNRLSEQILFVEYCQYLFFTQWKDLKKYAEARGIKIMGDVPIYVSADSVEVWCNPELFKLKGDKTPNKIAGVPPDYYSKDGQLWGSPVYDWDMHEKTNYKWWIWRLKHASELFDIIRIDHFRGLLQYWEVPAGEKTARNGQWCDAPGLSFIWHIKEMLPNVEFVAEDLGIIGNDVRQFVEDSDIPGMRVLVFGIEHWQDNEHLPHHSGDSIYYSSTHDSETLMEKLRSLSPEDNKFIKAYLKVRPGEEQNFSVFHLLFCSPSPLLIIPFWDLLLLGKEARFNTPGTVGDHNWTVRLNSYKTLDELAQTIRKYVEVSKRC